MISSGGQSNFTHKGQEALLYAQDLARERGQQQIDALHLLHSLLSQDESVVLNLLQRMSVDIEGLKRKVKLSLEHLPAIAAPQTFGQFYLTQDMAKVLDRARQEAIKMGDEYISIEHLFLSLLDTKSGAKDVLEKVNFLTNGEFGNLKSLKLDYEAVVKVLSQIRGGQRITDPEPESKY